MMRIRSVLALVAALAIPALVSAQTLPQSTQDRQAIANLTYQANLPGTSAADRAEIARRITALEYQINTRSPIEPMPTIAPNNWTGSIGSLSDLPRMDPNAAPVVPGPTMYGSCDGDRAVVAYLNEQLQSPRTTRQERNYAAARRNELEKDLRSRGC